MTTCEWRMSHRTDLTAAPLLRTGVKKSAVCPFNPENLRDGDMSLFFPQVGGIEKATDELNTELGHNGSRTMIW